MNSPLGKYAAPAAAIASLGIIGVALGGLLFGQAIGVTPEAQNQLNVLAGIAAGALFGSSVAVNGYKGPVEAAHRRLDTLAAATEANTAAILATDTTGHAPAVLAAVPPAIVVAESPR